MAELRNITLTEYEPCLLDKSTLSEAEGQLLLRRYNKHLKIEFPTPVTDDKWRLTSQGWVGYIPLTSELSISILPKVPISNLFRMFEYAYRLKSFEFLGDLAHFNSLPDFYDNLAIILAKRILDRVRKGIFREYCLKNEKIPFISGCLDTNDLVQKPWDVNKRCIYEEHSTDIQDNQIIFWTLFRIARSGLCSERSAFVVRRAYRALVGTVSLVPCDVRDCIGRKYNRLNGDYRLLHALCRFFLENTGPDIYTGKSAMLPFLVNMARLYELFVAEWLRAHLPPTYELRSQEQIDVGEDGAISFNIDLVISDATSKEVLYVLDTKYKRDTNPSVSDFNQIIVYAVAKKCREAVLIYPTDEISVFSEVLGNIHARSTSFSLDGELEQAGYNFIEQLLTD